MLITADNSTIRILVADDDDMTRSTLAAMVRRLNYQCDEAKDAYEACAMLGQRKYQALLSDINMPGNCSLELLDAADEVAPGVPVILITAAPSRETAVSAVGTQVARYLEKPATMDQLRDAIEAALRGKAHLEAQHRELMTEVVTVLSETRQNFKSRRLGAIRVKVENALHGFGVKPKKENERQ